MSGLADIKAKIAHLGLGGATVDLGCGSVDAQPSEGGVCSPSGALCLFEVNGSCITSMIVQENLGISISGHSLQVRSMHTAVCNDGNLHMRSCWGDGSRPTGERACGANVADVVERIR